jgi:neopullulanase
MKRYSVLFACLLFTVFVHAQPQVSKIEPPNWWTPHSLTNLQILVTGTALTNASVRTDAPDVLDLVVTHPNPTHLILYFTLADAAKPGSIAFDITTIAGETSFLFPLLAPLPREGRFQGLNQDDILYLLMPDRFANGDESNDDPEVSRGLHDRSRSRFYHGGDLQGVIDKLPYLHSLGVTAIWLNPIYDNNNTLNQKETYNNQAITDYHGYGAIDFYAVDEHFGDMALFTELVDKAHALGMKIVQDQVANHTGPYHDWVQNPPTPDWYYGTEEAHLANHWQTWTLPDPYATPDTQRATLEGWFIDILPDLNQDNEHVKQYLIQNTLWWIGMTGLDAIRQDTLPYVHRRFWRDWTSAIKAEYPEMNVLGEFFDGDAVKVSFYQGGQARFDGIDSGIDLLFDFPLFYKLRDAFGKGKFIRDIAIELAHDHLYVNPQHLVTFLDLHDVSRFISEEGASIAGLCLAFTFQMTARGIPLIYYGTEIAMPGGNDPDNRRDFPGGWKDDARNAFTRLGRTANENKVIDHVKQLTALRKNLTALRRGAMINLLVNEQQYVYARAYPGETVIVACNNDLEKTSLAFSVRALHLEEGGVWEDQLQGHADITVENQTLHVTLPARQAAIFTIKNRQEG